MNQSIKYLTFLFLAFSVFTYQSCDNETLEGEFGTDTGNTDPAGLVGDWEMVSFEAETTTNSNYLGQAISVNGVITGSDFDYVVTFTEDAYTTNGSYTLSAVFYMAGMEMENGSETYSNVSGSGTYTTENGTMTISDPFFTFEFQGMDLSEFGGQQTTDYNLSNDGQILTLSQNETINETVNGVETTTQINSTTVLYKI